MNDWGDGDTLAVAAFRYCLGRRTYMVGICEEWLIRNWDKFDERVRICVERELEEAFKADDIARENDVEYKPLGDDCDRKSWERVRKLYLSGVEK